MAAASQGFFISLEGGEGSGKTTQARRLAAWLEDAGEEVLLLREPGSTAVGEQVRTLLFGRRDESEILEPVAETLLFHAARAQLVRRRILPALAGGTIVITDRYADSTVAYQGYGLGLDIARIEAVNAWATGGLMPRLTLLFDFDPAMLATRGKGKTPTDPIEARSLMFHTRVRRGYLALADRFPERIQVIDAHPPADTVFAEACRLVARRLPAADDRQAPGAGSP